MYYNDSNRYNELHFLIGGTFIIVQNLVLVNRKMKVRYFFVNLSKITDFGLCVKTKLLQNGKNLTWLQEEVKKKTGLYVDGSYLNKILTGKRNAPKIVAAICEILNIEKE